MKTVLPDVQQIKT